MVRMWGDITITAVDELSGVYTAQLVGQLGHFFIMLDHDANLR